MEPRDFTDRAGFPGTTSSPFDWLVRFTDLIERVPGPLFALLLVALAVACSRGDVSRSFGMMFFFYADWLLILMLPRAGKSYGPPQPPTLMLALLRVVPALFLPLGWLWIAQSIGTALVIYAFWIEPHHIRLTRQRLESAKLRDGFNLRLLHLGDLHIERITAREHQLIALVNSIKPDLILFSGDFLNLSNVDDPVAWEQCRAILGQLTAPLGVFAVTGSPPVDQPAIVARLLEGINIRWLKNELVALEQGGQKFNLIGLTCTHQPSIDAPRLRELIGGETGRFTILLYHTPDLAPEAARAGVDLQLSGHTHGGQVRLPFWGALYTSSLYGKQLEIGRIQINNLTLYVTRGLGMEGKGAPRVRFLSPPEIVLWEIRGVNATVS